MLSCAIIAQFFSYIGIFEYSTNYYIQRVNKLLRLMGEMELYSALKKLIIFWEK